MQPVLLPLALTSTTSSQFSTGTDVYAPANFAITSWTGPGCTGIAIPNPDLKYDYNMETETLSYNLSRPLAPGEQLDWSGMPAGWAARRSRGLDEYCGAYEHSAAVGQGMEFERTLTCFRLWRF